ncbi:MAG: hypothetical protein Q9164_006371 [Protoblastenia rupestris]
MHPISPEGKSMAANEEDLSLERGIPRPVRRLDGKIDRWAPQYLAYNQPLGKFANIDLAFQFKISDLSAAFFFDSPLEKSIMPVASRSPELILTKKLDKKFFDILPSVSDIDNNDVSDSEYEPSDIDPDLRRDGNDTDDEHLLDLHDQIGRLPQELCSQWSRSKLYFNGQATIPDSPPLEQFFDEEMPPEMDAVEADMVKPLLRQILRYDATKRPSTKELLQHPWFQENLSNGH